MMNVVCPLCGRHIPETVFDPSEFQDDIYAVDVSGLGRGRGFQVTGQYSILGDPMIMGLISDRCHRILHIIQDGGYLPPQELDALRATLDSWIQYAHRLEAENASLREENEELSEVEEEDGDDYESSRLLRKINGAVSFDFDDLEEAIDFLLEN